MVLENAESRESQERAEQTSRLAQAFGTAGRTARAQRLEAMAARNTAKAASVRAVLNRNVPQASGSVEYVRQKDLRTDKREKATYEPVSVRTENGVTIVERRGLLTDRGSRYTKQEPYVMERTVVDANGEVVSREVYDTYETKGGREKAYLARRETPEQEREIGRSAGGEKTRDIKTDLVRGTIREENTDAPTQEELQAERQAQRDRFTGANAEITAVQDERGNTFQGSVRQGVFTGVRSVSEEEQALRAKQERLIEVRANPGLFQGSGGSVLVREGAQGGKIAAETFKDLGAPETEEKGSIVFVRKPEPTLGDQAREFLTGKKVEQPFSELARKSSVSETTYEVPNATSATLAGFPTTDEQGRAINFPARFSVLTEEREEYGRPGLLERNAPGAARAIEQGQAKLLAIDERAVEMALKDPEGAGKPIRRVRELGGILEKGGIGIQKGGEVIEEIGFSNDPSKVFPIAGKGVRVAGEFVQGEGLILQQRPVTGGVGEALAVGAGFGILRRGAIAAEAFGAREGLTGIRLLGKGTRVAETIGGTALGGAYVVQTGKEVLVAQPGAERGRVLAQGVNEAVAFGAGARLGPRAVRATGEGLLKAETSLREMGRAGEVGGRSAKQRSGRITKSELRNRKSARALAPKYEVTRELDKTTFALRGKARERTEELRVLEKQATRERVDTVEFFNDRGVQGVVKGRGTVTRVRPTDVAFPGEPSPRIAPVQGRERSPTLSQDRARRGRPKVSGIGRVPLSFAQPRASNAVTGANGESAAVTLTRLVKPRKELVTTAAPKEAVRERVPESPYRQRLAVRTVYPTYVGAPEVLPGPQSTSGLIRGSPEYRRQLALAKLREVAAARQEKLLQEQPKKIELVEAPAVVEPKVRGSQIGNALRAKSLLGSASDLGRKVRGVPEITLATSTRSRLAERSLLGQSSRSLQLQEQTQATQSLQVQAKQQEQLQGLRQASRAKTSLARPEPPRVEPVFEPPRPPTIAAPRRLRDAVRASARQPEELTPYRPLKLPGLKQEGSETGYAVLVKRFGKFSRVDKGVLPRAEALRLGASIVEMTPAQTFEIVPTSERVRKRKTAEGSLTNALRQVRKVEERSGRELYREQRQFAINTGGEYQGISVKGQQARRRGSLLRAVGL